jgi:hypothetical protein
MISRRRASQLAILAVVGGLATGAGLLLSEGGGATLPHTAATDTGGASPSVPDLPDQVPVAGPNGYVGTVPKSDIVEPPPLTAAGTPPPVADYPGASIVLGGGAGYPVMNNGTLVGYWVPGHHPTTFVTIAEAESENAVPSQGASPVGTATAVTPPPSVVTPAP